MSRILTPTAILSPGQPDSRRDPLAARRRAFRLLTDPCARLENEQGAIPMRGAREAGPSSLVAEREKSRKAVEP